MVVCHRASAAGRLRMAAIKPGGAFIEGSPNV